VPAACSPGLLDGFGVAVNPLAEAAVGGNFAMIFQLVARRSGCRCPGFGAAGRRREPIVGSPASEDHGNVAGMSLECRGGQSFAVALGAGSVRVQMDMPRKEKSFAAPQSELDLPGLEHEILKFWKEQRVVERSLAPAAHGVAERPAFVFNDGPPFATGLPHYGHLLAGTIKDVIPRYQSMKGYQVERRFGWDCHGLPIESLVEEELNVHGRAEIEALGVPAFNDHCRKNVLRFTREWEQVVTRMGRWVDFENDYKTMDRSFMESVWWVFRQLWDKGLIYEGHRVQPVSPALGTTLSNFEVAQGPQERDPATRKDGHKRRQDPSVTLRFQLEDEEASLWAWTTTPWTLPSNLALAVHPEVEYARVRVLDTSEIAYVEPGRLADYQARERVGATEELARVLGADLVGRPYVPLLPYFADRAESSDGRRQAFRVVAADYVTIDSGTGIVHQAPAFGEDDYAVGQKEGLPLVNPVTINGVFDATVPDFEGLFVKDAEKGILEKLKRDGRLVDQDVLMHPYPHCYRTDQPLLYMAQSTWFMRVEDQREELSRNNEDIRWVPDHVGRSRFGNWLENARDWNLSRNRYWGTPLPIWRCDENPTEMVCIGSCAELESLAGLDAGSLTDLHREYVDDITFPSAETPGGTMRRIPEVFDCWFESGSMPYAQNHYPFDEAKRSYVEEHLPADFIAEGLDQTRGWFYTLHVLANALFGRPAFRNVIVNGLILAADGKKMSKRLKNYPDPGAVIERYGADALRAYIINSPAVRAEPMRFGRDAQDTEGEGVREMARTVILPLWNAYNFLVTYARADGWSPSTEPAAVSSRNELDQWILSRLQSYVAAMGEEFDSYRLYNLLPAFIEICDDLNNWYIRRGRRRYWRSREEGGEDKDSAYRTLYEVLVTLTRSIAPILPFFSEFLHQRLVVDLELEAKTDGDSVHLESYPVVEPLRRNADLEESMAMARRVVGLGLSLRERERIGVRRPLPALTVASPDQATRAAVERHLAHIVGELNVKTVTVVEADEDLIQVSAKANFKKLGKRLGKKMKLVADAVAALGADEVRRLMEGGTLEVLGESLDGDDLLIQREPLPGLVVESEAGVTVALDTAVDQSLLREGLVRELINRVQALRKTAGLDVSDRIQLRVVVAGELQHALEEEALASILKAETLSEHLILSAGEPLAHVCQEAIDEIAVEISIQAL
jgi:isoleucyl-tRNA synthetase